MRHRRPPGLILLTEQYTWRQARALRRALGSAWSVRRHGEGMACVRRGEMDHRRGRKVRVTYVYNPLEAWRDLWLSLFLIVHVASGIPLRVLLGHWHSSIEKGASYRTDNPRGVRAHQRGLDKTGARIAEERAKHPHWLHVVAGDTNTAVENPPWSDNFEDRTGTRQMWRRVHDAPPTHAGGRTIDTIAVVPGDPYNARLVDPDVTIPQPPDCDHRGVSATLEFTVDGRTYRLRIVEISGRFDARRIPFARFVARVGGVETDARGRAIEPRTAEIPI